MNSRRCDFLAKADILRCRSAEYSSIAARHDVAAFPEDDAASPRRPLFEKEHLAAHRAYDGKICRYARDERRPASRREHDSVRVEVAIFKRDAAAPPL